MEHINKYVNGLRLWIFFRNLIDKLQWTIPAGFVIGMVFEIIACVKPWYYVHWFAFGSFIVSIMLGLIWSLICYPSKKKAALILDKTGLKERTVTALELEGDDSIFAEIQREDAWEMLKDVKYKKRLPITVTWKRPACAGMLLAMLLVAAFIPTMSKSLALEKHNVSQEAKKEAEKIEKLEKALKDVAKISETDMKEYKEMMDDIKKELKEADTKEALEKAKERAKTKFGQELAKQKSEKAKTAESKLQKLDNKLKKDGDASKLDKEDMKAAADALKELTDLENVDPDSLSQEELEALEALENLQGQMQSGKLSSSDMDAAKAALAAMQTSNNASMSNNQQSSNGNKNGQNQNGSGNGSGSGSGQGNGNGSGNGNGNGSGSGNGSGNGTGGGWNYGSKDGTEKDQAADGEMLSIPNGLGNDDNLTGRKNDGSTYTIKGGQSLAWAGSRMNYSQVFSQYKRQAMSRVSGANYPSGVQDIIKSYFSNIEK